MDRRACLRIHTGDYFTEASHALQVKTRSADRFSATWTGRQGQLFALKKKSGACTELFDTGPEFT
jgi:hypothetical protein